MVFAPCAAASPPGGPMFRKTSRVSIVAAAAASAIVASLAVGLTAAGGAAASGTSTDGQHVQLDRAFVIVLENHSQHSVIGDANAPFISSLAQKYGEAADYFGVTHPSEPNYVAMISGSNWFINNDNPANTFDRPDRVHARHANRMVRGAHMQALPVA